ncbi:MAG: chitobiase/beta-hexosaminidase C-terminal domain-containing protein [Ferruginibacter sp.]
MSFQNSRTVSISTPQKDAKIFYTTDGSEPTGNSMSYAGPITVNRSQTIKALAIDARGTKSFVTTAVYKKMAHDWGIKLNTNYEQLYEGGGAMGLVDGIRGETNWRKGNWQGYQNTGVDVTIDLKKIKTISRVSAGFLQDTRAWIVMPKTVSVEISVDGKKFKKVSEKNNLLSVKDLNVQLKTAELRFKPQAARYVRLKAAQYGKLPEWHESPGGDTHIFIDEIYLD